MPDPADIQHVVKLSTFSNRSCGECSEWRVIGDYSLQDHANHYLTEHGYRVLHVGQETNEDNDGNPVQSTVMVLGTTDATNVRRRDEERQGETLEKYIAKKKAAAADSAE